MLSEYESLDELNYLADKLDEMSDAEVQHFKAIVKMGEHSDSVQDLINLTENLDCYEIYQILQTSMIWDITLSMNWAVMI